MTQSFPTSAQIVYETLASDTELMDIIGNYEFKAGQTGDAISIVTAGQDMPSLRNVSGIECVIQDSGATVQQNYLHPPGIGHHISVNVQPQISEL